MKAKLFLTLFILVLRIMVLAQPHKPTEVLYDSLHQGIQSTAICPAVDGGYIISGLLQYNNNGLILKVDTGGNVIWNTSFSHYNHITVYNVVAVDSFYIIAGNTNDSASGYGLGLLLKIDKMGTVIWSKTYKSSLSAITLTSVQATNDTGFIICGYQTLTSTSVNQIFVVKTDAGGNMQWHSLLGQAGNDTKSCAVKQLPDSSFVVLGTLDINTPEPILISLSKSGVLNWTKMYTLNSSGHSYGNDLIISRQSLILNISAGNNGALLRTDFSGNQVWSKFYYSSASLETPISINQIIPSRVHQSADSGYFFTANGFMSLFNKTDSAGNLQFSKQLIYSSSVDALLTPDKGYLIVGNGPLLFTRPLSNSPSYAPQIGLIKIDSVGNPNFCSYLNGTNMSSDAFTTSSITLTSSTGVTQANVLLQTHQPVIEVAVGCVQATGGIQSYANSIEVTFYPNPAGNNLTIVSSIELGTIILYNSLGQKVIQMQTKETTSQIDISGLQAGVYFIQTNAGIKKFIKE